MVFTGILTESNKYFFLMKGKTSLILSRAWILVFGILCKTFYKLKSSSMIAIK